VATAAWVSFVGAVVFFERSFFSKGPVIKLTPFRRPTFVMACVLNAVIGFGLYSATYLAPVFLGRIRGFSSLQIGETVFVTGLAMAVGAPLAARLSTRVDGRYVVAVGFTLFAAGLWMFSYITPEWGYAQMFAPQIVRGFAVLLCIVPAVGMALNGVPPSELRYASGLFNLMRNLGGAVGIAVVNTWVINFSGEHALRLSEGMAQNRAAAGEMLSGLAANAGQWTPDPALALATAQAQMAHVVGRAATTLAFADTFRLMAWVFIAALIIVPFCKPAPAEAAPVSEH
jgi:DHA2 family multidrug resistance protein